MKMVKTPQEVIAALPAVSKIERQTDMYLSTRRSYVEAIGGELDVIVRLPNRAPVEVMSLEDVAGA
jgi:carbon monoxide dehydrogenase subunit G